MALVSDETTTGLYHGLAPPDSNMPYVEYHCISNSPVHAFASGSSYDDCRVQFSIFDNDNNVTTTSSVRDAIVSAYDRTALVYATLTQVGCLRETELGPIRLEDAWQWTIDFRIMFT